MIESRAMDVLVIGSGIAGLTFALKTADHAQVVLVTKKRRADSSTNYAQGGIAAVMDPEDEFELHVRDTLKAGAGLCHEAAVRALVREGPQRVRELMDWGARFTTERGRLSLGREGGHSRRRIVHAQDLTGREIERALLDAVADHPGIEILEDHVVLDLIVGGEGARRACGGALVYDHRGDRLLAVRARRTLLASGGLGRVYRHTTNPDIATGDGVAMAYRAGATVANLEFVQFHPTALYPAEGQAILISEAVRGEGAVLRTRAGDLVMAGHAEGSLSTRDIVARAIDRVLKERADPFVLLDLSPIGADTIARRFPYIVEACAARGVDALRDPVPVVPAAHYACGGVLTDQDGRTAVRGLYAAGEVACTGVHGANRLASNSLLEAVVYSHRAALAVRAELGEDPPEPAVVPVVGAGAARDGGETAAIGSDLRGIMWDDCGIVRSDARLEEAQSRVHALRERAEALWARGPVDADAAEMRNLCQVAALIVRSARSRKESRGLHFNVDHPRTDERFRADTVPCPLAASD
ncbi:MAG TPA: L-aspartate oxidase [Longimicrobiales bacterium]|nr:L-aspartate oxidase [Longimicrobiales bacterium]